MLSFSLICLNLIIVGVLSSKAKDFECDTSARLENGHYTIARKVGFLKASCRRGYSLAGNKFVYCDNRSWTATLPKCVRATCPKRFTAPEHALKYETHQGAVVSIYCHSGYSLIGADTIYCNGSVWKPTLPACVRTRDRKPERRCDFDTDMCGFTHDPNHDFDWSRENSLTPRYHVATGPKYDHSRGVAGAVNGSGYYMFIESSSQQYLDTARLYSPVYEPQSRNLTCLRFFYHMFGSGMGELRVFVKPIDTPSFDDSHVAFERSGDQGDRWWEAFVRLNSLSGEFQVVFEGIRGNSVVSNIAIDDFELIDNCTTPTPSIIEQKPTQPPPRPPIVESCQRICGSLGVSCSCQTDCARNSSCCVDYALYCFLDLTTMENIQTTPTNRIAINNAHTSPNEESSSVNLAWFAALLPIVAVLLLIVVIGIVAITRLRNRDFYAKDTDLTSSVHFLSNDEEINFDSPYNKVA